jgi:hypothetical protein
MVGMIEIVFCVSMHAMEVVFERSQSSADEALWIEAFMKPENEHWRYTQEHVFLLEKQGGSVKLAARWPDVGIILSSQFAAFRSQASEGKSPECHAAYLKALEHIAERGTPGEISNFIKNEEPPADKVESPSIRKRKLTKRGSLHNVAAFFHLASKEKGKKEK